MEKHSFTLKYSGFFTIHIDLEALFVVALPYVRVSHLRKAGYLQSRCN